MPVFDEASLERQRVMAEVEAQRQRDADGVRAFQETYRFINETDVGSWERQAGKRMVRTVFEEKLTRLNPNLSFYTWYPAEVIAETLHLPKGMGIRDVYRNLPNGRREKLSRFRHEPILNEYSVVILVDKKIPSFGADGFLERNLTDLPKVNRTRLPDGTWDVEFEGTANTEQIIKEPAGEIRGWRSVLLQLIQAKALDLDAVEREFGAGDRLTWAAKLNKQKGLQVTV